MGALPSLKDETDIGLQSDLVNGFGLHKYISGIQCNVSKSWTQPIVN